jgi:hypothetical protein
LGSRQGVSRDGVSARDLLPTQGLSASGAEPTEELTARFGVGSWIIDEAMRGILAGCVCERFQRKTRSRLFGSAAHLPGPPGNSNENNNGQANL